MSHYGFNFAQNSYEFDGWSELWKAVCTQGHPLAEYAAYLNNKRQSLVEESQFWKVRVSFDTVPPIVENFAPRWIGRAGALIIGLGSWAALCFLVRSLF
jgi:hypothetical protein